MKSKNHRPLGLEELEDRWVPATVRFDGSNLFIFNPLITAGASKVSVIEVANGFQVKDGISNNGTYAVTGNIFIQGNNAKDTVIVTLNATGLAGGLTVNTGNSASTVTVDGSAAGAFIASNSRISVGNGANSVAFGSTVGLSERGLLQVSARGFGANTVTVGGGANASTVGGNLSVFGFPTVTLGGTKGDTFAGGVTIGNFSNGQAGTVQLKTGATDLGNFLISGGQGNTTLKVDGNVLGNLYANLGNGTNSITLAGGGTAVTIGNLFINAGNGTNSFTANGGSATTVNGNALVNLGNGANAFGSSAGLVVNGNMLILDGNGGLDVATNTFKGTVNGNLQVITGNGSNLFTLDVTGGGNVAGTFIYNGGNGGNSVTINNTTTNGTVLNIRFGNGSANLMTLNAGSPGNGNLTGFIAWGVPTMASAGNGFVDNGYVWQTLITLINIPS